MFESNFAKLTLLHVLNQHVHVLRVMLFLQRLSILQIPYHLRVLNHQDLFIKLL